MKKQLLIILCSLAFAVSGLAQLTTGRLYEKYAEKFKNKRGFIKEKPVKEKKDFFQKQIALLQKQNPTKSPKDTDRWEPENIYGYYTHEDYDERWIFSYEKGNRTVELMQAKFQILWENYLKIEYRYDIQNNMTAALHQYWEINRWVISFKRNYTYDKNNNLITILLQEWESGKFIDVMRLILTYDEQNNLSEDILQDWEEEWINVQKLTYTWENNNLTEVLYQDWEESEWKDAFKEEYTYNEFNNLEELIIKFWDKEQWWDIAKIIFIWDDQQQNLISGIFQFWDMENEQCNNDEKVSFKWDEHNNMKSELWQEWIEDKWIDTEKRIYFYDENNNSTSGNSQIWTGNEWIDCNCGLDIYYNNMQSFYGIDGCSFTATYINVNDVGISENNFSDTFRLYPNPVSDILYIETNKTTTSEIEVFSVQGVLLLNAKGNQIDVSSLPNGNYILKVSGD